jgi:glycosyltransferase involved in cell wall biosynthesis
MPSVGESFGYAILEAMSCGLPIIASRSGAFPELLGNAGILFNPDDSEELAKLVELLRAESSLRIELSRKARERAVKFFDYRRMASEYISVYRSN